MHANTFKKIAKENGIIIYSARTNYLKRNNFTSEYKTINWTIKTGDNSVYDSSKIDYFGTWEGLLFDLFNIKVD